MGFQIYIKITLTAKDPIHVPIATTKSDLSQKLSASATASPATAAGTEPVEYSIAGKVIADRTV